MLNASRFGVTFCYVLSNVYFFLVGEAQGDVVLLGELAELSCSLNDGEADRVEWIGPNRCVSEECGHDIIENHTFLSLSYAPEQDEAFTCRFVFGDEYQDHVAPVDVISEYIIS